MTENLRFHAMLEGNILLVGPEKDTSSAIALILTGDLVDALQGLYADPSGVSLAYIKTHDPEDRCWPIAEIRRRTNIPTSTIRRWCAEDHVRYIRRGKGYGPHLDSVLAYAAEIRKEIQEVLDD